MADVSLITKKATSVQVKVVESTESLLTSLRWRVGLCCFFALFFTQTFRVNFSVGLACMVGENSSNSLDVSNLSSIISPSSIQGLLLGDGGAPQNGQFNWSQETQGSLLSAYGYGYVLSHIPGGWLSRRYGSRYVIGFSMIVAMVITALTPTCARTHHYLLFAARAILGAAQGTCFPAVYNLAGRWIPPDETSRFIALCTAGFPLGVIVTNVVSSILCRIGFANGWGSIFYVFDIASVLWIILWFYVVYDSPIHHPRISEKEKDYILASVGRLETKSEQREMTPWCSIVASPPVWATAVGYFTNSWIDYILQIGFIIYLEDVLGYESSGFVAFLPFIAQFISGIFVSLVTDALLKRHVLSRVNTRRILQSISFGCIGSIFIVSGFPPKEFAGLVVAFLVLARVFYGFSMAGFMVSVMDFAPRYAGEISGILNLVASLPGLVVPIVTTALVTNNSQTEWRNVFLVSSGVAISGGAIFCIFIRAEVQKWAGFEDSLSQLQDNMDETQKAKSAD